MSALKLEEEDNFEQNQKGDDIDLKEIAEMKQFLIDENKRLAKETQSFFKRVKSGEKIPKEEDDAHTAAMKQLRRLETSYNALLRMAKKQGIKEKDIEEQLKPNIDNIKNEPSSMGAIVRNLN